MAKRTKVTKREIDLATGVVLGHIIYDAMSDLTRMIIADELRWITIHPNGKGAKLSNGEENVKGKPVLIDTETGKIVGGAIPQSLHGVKLQSKEEREKNGSKSFKEIIKSGENQTNAPDNNTSGSNNAAGVAVDPNSDPVSYAHDPNADYSAINTLSARHAFLQERIKKAKPISFDSSEAECKDFLKSVLPQTQCHIFKDYDKKGVAQMSTGAAKIIAAFPLLGECFNSFQDKSSYLQNLKEFDNEVNQKYIATKKIFERNLEKALTEEGSEVKAYADKTNAVYLERWFGEGNKFQPNFYFSQDRISTLSKQTQKKLHDFFKENGLSISLADYHSSQINKLDIPQALVDSIKSDLANDAIDYTRKYYKRLYKPTLEKLKQVDVKSYYQRSKYLSGTRINGFCAYDTETTSAEAGIRTTVKPIKQDSSLSNIVIHPNGDTQTGLDSDVQGKWHTAHSSKYSGLVHTTVHEMAHALHSMIEPERKEKTSVIKSMFDDFCKRELGPAEAARLERLRARGARITGEIKCYKYANSSEYFAEMVTEALLSDNPCQEAIKVFDYAKMLYNSYIK